jgi:hypothetical protein
MATDGGALYNQSTAGEVSRSTFTDNHATDKGGAIYNDLGANLTLRRSTVQSNTAGLAGGGVFNAGTITTPGSTITGNTPDNCDSC